MDMTTYPDTVIHRARALIAESFRLPARHPWSSRSSGAQGELVAKERNAAEKVEAELSEAFGVVCELVRSTELVTGDEAKAAAARYAKAYMQANEKSAALEAKYEETKTEGLALAEARADAALSRLLDEALPLTGELLDELAEAESAQRGLVDKNPAQRRGTSGKPPRRGGKLLDQLRTILEEIGQPDTYVLTGDQYRLWARGESCVDVYGNDATGAPGRKIRRSHATLRDVANALVRS
jgi:hypothetical protein